MPASFHNYGPPAFRDISGVLNRSLLSLPNRQYSIKSDTLHDRFKDEIIDPWIRSLKGEGERLLLRSTRAELYAATSMVTSALHEQEDRFRREVLDLFAKKLAHEEIIAQLTAVCSNLWAAEGALTELSARLNGWRTQIGP